MTPREKAHELVEYNYSKIEWYLNGYYNIKMKVAKVIASKSVDEILEAVADCYNKEQVDYWSKVKIEIEKIVSK